MTDEWFHGSICPFCFIFQSKLRRWRIFGLRILNYSLLAVHGIIWHLVEKGACSVKAKGGLYPIEKSTVLFILQLILSFLWLLAGSRGHLEGVIIVFKEALSECKVYINVQSACNPGEEKCEIKLPSVLEQNSVFMQMKVKRNGSNFTANVWPLWGRWCTRSREMYESAVTENQLLKEKKSCCSERISCHCCLYSELGYR